MTLDAADAMRQAARAGACSDADLLALFRAGDSESYGVLWQRHRAAALRAGRALMPNADAAQDLVQDAFHQVAAAINAGFGPRQFFRAYLFTTMRNRATRLRRLAEREVAVDDVGDVPIEDLDPVIAELDRRLAVAAFHGLPDRLRRVIWHVDVERQPLAHVAELLGTTPNNVARLVGRARVRLRTLFLQAHVERCDRTQPAPGCARVQASLGAHFTGELSNRASEAVDEHLSTCRRCASIRDMVVDLASPIGRSLLRAPGASARGA